MISLRFAGGSDLGAAAIKWFSAGAWSHVDSVLPDGRLLGARDDHIGGAPPGVQVRPAGYTGSQQSLVVHLAASDAMTAAYHTFLAAQVGKPYDEEGILGFIAGRRWDDPAAWFCSELVAAGLQQCGFFRFPLAAPANKITPNGLLLAISACAALDVGEAKAA